MTEQIIRPTGLLDPVIQILQTENQMEVIINNIHEVVKKNQKVFITAITIKQSEDITSFLQERNIKVAYLHSELKTLERNQVLQDLRRGVYDVIVGVNLLREGIDIPEVSLVCVLEADKQGFLRNTRSLIQIVGRAARNSDGRVIFFADSNSPAMLEAIEETNRRRNKQMEYNTKNNITPKTIIKKISDFGLNATLRNKVAELAKGNKKVKLTEKQKLIEELRKEMLEAAKEQNYEKAAELRDVIIEVSAE